MPSHDATSVAASPLLLLLLGCPGVLSARAESYCKSGTHDTNGRTNGLAVAASNVHLLNAPNLPDALTSFSDYCDMCEVMDGLSKLTDMHSVHSYTQKKNGSSNKIVWLPVFG